MPEIAIRLYGQRPSFDAKAGPLTVLIEVEGGTSGYLFDRERERCRIASFPGTERDKWTGPVGVLLAARRGWLGLSIRLDVIPIPSQESTLELDLDRDFRRPHLPRDLASCPRCGMLVILERARKGNGVRVVTPTRRLARRAEQVMQSDALFPFATASRGRGRKTGLDHDYHCYSMPWFQPFADAKPRRRVGRPRVEKPVKVPLAYMANRDYSKRVKVKGVTS